MFFCTVLQISELITPPNGQRAPEQQIKMRENLGLYKLWMPCGVSYLWAASEWDVSSTAQERPVSLKNKRQFI